jgi:Uncharacterized protein conserved in bacteria
MVVRFTPTPDDESARARAARLGRAAGQVGEPAGGERLAPVSYLPGARPSGAAAEALRRVETMRRSDEEHAVRAGGVGGRPRPGRDGGESERESGRTASRASNVSMHQLARRGMSRWELQQVLDKRGVDEATARAELDRLQSVGLLDDAALALTLVYTQHTRKGLGRSAIAHELRRRHIDQSIIEDALSEIADDDELERAMQLAHKRVTQLRGLDEQTARRRLTGYLARKGYGSDVLRHAVESALHGGPPDEAEFDDGDEDSDDPRYDE